MSNISEVLIKQSIEALNRHDASLKLELKEKNVEVLMRPPLDDMDDEVVSKEVELSIFKNGKRIFTQNFFQANPWHRKTAFDRMLNEIVLKGLTNPHSEGIGEKK